MTLSRPRNGRAPDSFSTRRLGWLVLVLGGTAVLAGCDLAYPEVVVVNKTKEPVQLRNVSFNGCVWEGVLAYGESTLPARCLPGDDRVHFEKFDSAGYCRRRVEDGGVDGSCPCSNSDASTAHDAGTGQPTWFNYQTSSVKHVEYGEFHVFEIDLTDIEQDFSVPGPYGH